MTSLPLFLLYEGTSTDGRGFPKFKCRTYSVIQAFNHWKKTQKSQYDIGQVKMITDVEQIISTAEQWKTIFSEQGVKLK